MSDVTDPTDRQHRDAAIWSSYLTPGAELRRLGLVCHGTGAQRGPVRPVVDRSLDRFAVVFVDGGSGRLELDREYRIGPGTLFWLAADQRHSYGPDAGGWSERWVLFDGPAVSVYRRAGLMDARSSVASIGEQAPLLRIFAQIRRVCDGEVPHPEVALSALLHQLIVLADEVSDQQQDTVATAVLKALRGNAIADLGIAEHAAMAGLSVAELRVLVRTATGLSPKAYLIRTRINLAKSLLADSSLPVARVAARTGYPDPGYFSRLFSSQVGMSPAVFRERYLRGWPE